MELKQLKAFVVVAEHLHFGIAAEHLRLAQPQVSRRIAQLEESLDVVLFERNSRTVKLTDVGAAFLPEAMSLLKTAESARQRAVERARGKHGLFRVSVNDAAMVGSVTPILKTYHRRYPDVYMSFVRNEGTSLGQIEQLVDGKADVAFTHPPPDRYTADLDQVLLVNDPLVAVLPDKHRLAGRGVLDLHDLANETWVMFPRENNAPIYDRIIALCQSSGFSPRVVHETGHMLTRLGLIAGGFGVHLVHSAWKAMPYPGIAYVAVEPTARVQLSCFWRRGNNSPLVQNMVEIARAHAL